MRLAIGQLSSRAGDFEATCARMLAVARRAKAQGAELVVFPFALLTGTMAPDWPDEPDYYLDLLGALQALADATPVPLLASVSGGLAYADSTLAVLVGEGAVRPVPATEGPGGRGPSCPRLTVGGTSLVVAYTYDQLDDLMDAGAAADVTLFVSSACFATDDAQSAMGAALAEGSLREDVGGLGSWLVGVGSLGGYGAQVYCGSSYVLAPWGEIAAQAPSFEEDLLVADVDPSSEGPLAEPLAPEVYDRLLTLWQALARALADLLDAEGARGKGPDATAGASGPGVALTLDGSLTSSVLAVLATDALGPTRVHALLAAPEGPRAQGAAGLARALRVDARPLSDLAPQGDAADGAGRAAALVRLAGATGSVELSCADKTGLALEPDPEGAHAGRLAPLGDVYRSDVAALAHMRNTISPVIPRACCDAYAVPDVAGLADVGPTDEARLAFADFVLASRIEWERGVAAVAEDSGAPEAASAVCRAFADGEARRMAMPRVLQASARTVSSARRPLGNAWQYLPRDREGDVRLAQRLWEQIQAAEAPAEADGDEPDTPDERGRARLADEARDALGLLRDLAASGGLTVPDEDGQGAGGPHGQGRHGQPGQGLGDGLWRNPFSEN